MDGLIRLVTIKGIEDADDKGIDLVVPGHDRSYRDVAQCVYLFLEEVGSKQYTDCNRDVRARKLGASGRRYAQKIHGGDEFETVLQSEISEENNSRLMLTVDILRMQITLTEKGMKEATLPMEEAKAYANNPGKYASSPCLPRWGERSIRVYESLGALIAQKFDIGFDKEYGLVTTREVPIR
jgi:hypothetical protein|tara:strand:- start:4664 stop:5209 length:546 start_codon:yes stop_codon:yes gene_type:complete